MAFYRNPNCPYCGEAFTDLDDVVSCPECGAAHHRSCWDEHGGCARADRHGMPMEDPAQSPAAKRTEELEACSACGYRNRSGVAFCSGCGRSFRTGAPHTRPTVGFNPAMFDPSINFSADTDYEDVPAADVAKLVGTNTLYYMPAFARLRNGESGRFHFFALLFGGGWMMFRKMYKRGAIVLAIQALLRILESILFYVSYQPLYNQILSNAGLGAMEDLSQMTQEQANLLLQQLQALTPAQWAAFLIPSALSLIGLVFSVVIAFQANKWYYRDILHRAREIRSCYEAQSDAALMEQERRSGVNMGLAIGLMAGASVVTFFLDFVLPLLL